MALALDDRPTRAAPGRRHLRAVPAGGRRSVVVCRLHPARVYHRRRVAVAAAVAAVVAVVLGLGLGSGGAPPALRDAPGAGVAPATVVVGPGETLWEHVVPYTPAGAHPMAYIVEVAAYNDIDPRAVPPGTVLRLPPVRP